MAEYIEREAAINCCFDIATIIKCGVSESDAKRILEAFNEIPAADVRPVVRAHWYWDKDGMDWGIGSWRCSECHARPETWWQGDSTNPRNKSGHYFCPNCGADMRGDDTNSTT